MHLELETQIIQFLNAQPDIAIAWIYGSFARGQEKPTSDMDIAVAGHEVLTPERKLELTQQLSHLINREVDLVDLLAERGVIQSQVLTQGRLILKKDTQLLAILIKRYWYDRADYWPHRERIFSARRKKAFSRS